MRRKIQFKDFIKLKKFPFLVCPNALPNAGYSDFVQAVIRTGMKNVSLRADWLLSDIVEKNDLQCYAVCLTGNFATAELQEKLYKTMDAASKHGIPLVNIACKRDMSLSERNNSVAFFRDAADYAKEKSLQFTLETYGVVSRTAKECLRVLEEVDRDTLQICYDTANVWRFAPEFKSAEDLTADFRKLAGVVGFMHLKDCEPETQKIMTIGEGQVDFPAIFKLLTDWQYPGVIGLDLETARAGKINTVAAHEKELQLSMEYLSSLGVIE